jgi:PKD repeat protein
MRKFYSPLLVFAICCFWSLQALPAKAACNAGFQFTMGNCPTIMFFDASTSTSGAVTAWSWSFGDGGTSTLQNPSHTYTANGVYTVCLTITTQFGCGSQYCAVVTINCIQPSCQAGFTVNTSGCPQILFTDTSTPNGGISSWSWTFGDGGTSTSQNPAHTYLINGNYAVCLTITTPNQCTSTFCDTITINCNPTVSCQSNFTYTLGNCPTIGFFDGSNSTAGTINSWAWNFGDGSTSTLQNPSHTYTANGTYVVCLAIGTTQGCTNTYCDTLVINCIQPGNCQAYYQSTMPQCPTVMFFDASTSTAGAIVTWSWTFGDGTTSSLQNPSHTYTANGNYQVCLVIATANGCTNTYCDSININCIQPGQCQAAFTYTWTPNLVVYFTDQSTAGLDSVVSWFWTFGDGGTSTLQNPMHVYSTAGSYVVCLAIATANGCASTTCDTIQVGVNAAQDPMGQVGGMVAAPNPFAERFEVRYVLMEGMEVELSVYDCQGRKVAVWWQGERMAGEHVVDVDATGWAQGLYFLRLNGPGGSRSIPVMHR